MTGDAPVIVIGCLATGLLTFTLFYLKGLKRDFDKGQEAQDSKIEKLEGRLEELPEKYVFRDDFVRWTISIDKKIDDLAKDIKSLIKERSHVDDREPGD